MLSLEDEAQRQAKCFQAPRKEYKRNEIKWNKIEVVLGNLFPLELRAPAELRTAGARQSRSSHLCLHHSEAFQGILLKSERLWLHTQQLWIAAFSNPHLNKMGKEYSFGYQVQINTMTLMPAGLGSNCLSHAHAAQKYLQTFQTIGNYAQSTFSVSQPQHIAKNSVQKKRKKVLQRRLCQQ